MEIHHGPQIQADDDLQAICREIVEKRTIDEWDRAGSGDRFQSGPYEGGYDGIDQEFMFSYVDPSNKKWWISFSHPIAEKIANGDEYWLDLHEPF